MERFIADVDTHAGNSQIRAAPFYQKTLWTHEFSPGAGLVSRTLVAV